MLLHVAAGRLPLRGDILDALSGIRDRLAQLARFGATARARRRSKLSFKAIVGQHVVVIWQDQPAHAWRRGQETNHVWSFW